jgi:hypothetical protein
MKDELKSLPSEMDSATGYLRSSGVEHGLLINFGAPKFEIKKYALSRIGEVSRPGGLIGGTLSLFALLYPNLLAGCEEVW